MECLQFPQAHTQSKWPVFCWLCCSPPFEKKCLWNTTKNSCHCTFFYCSTFTSYFLFQNEGSVCTTLIIYGSSVWSLWLWVTSTQTFSRNSERGLKLKTNTGSPVFKCNLNLEFTSFYLYCNFLMFFELRVNRARKIKLFHVPVQ